MARDARLALPDDQGDLAHGEFHGAQKMHDAHPRRVRQGTEKVELASHESVIFTLLCPGQMG